MALSFHLRYRLTRMLKASSIDLTGCIKTVFFSDKVSGSNNG